MNWAIDGRDWPHRAHSRFVETGRVRWHVQIMGEGPVMLLLHGTGAATHSWRGMMPLLAEHFTVVAPDLPGHGFTVGRPLGGLAMSAMARAVGDLLRALDLTPHAIVGHSAGAAIAIRMALDGIATPRAIVGLDAALLPFPGLAAKLFPALARTPGETARFLARSTGSRIDAHGVDLYARLFGTAAHCAGAIGMMADWDLPTFARDLPRLKVPLLLIHGDGDTAIPPSTARTAAAMVADGRYIGLPGLGHLAHEEAPETIAALIRDFVGE